MQLVREPASGEGKPRQRGSTAQPGDPPHQCIAEPRREATVAFHLQRQHEQQAKQKRGQGSLPNPVHRIIDGIRPQSPNPSRPDGNGFVEDAASDAIDGPTGERREDAVETSMANPAAFEYTPKARNASETTHG